MERAKELKKAIMKLQSEIAGRKQAQELLRKSEERYKRLLESVTDYVYTVEIKDGRPASTFHDPNCEAVTGYTPDEYAVNPLLWHSMVYEEDKVAVLEQADRVLLGTGSTLLEHRIIHKNGSICWVRNTQVPRYDVRGRLISYDGVITDITDRKRAEESLHKAHDELESMVRERTEELIQANEALQSEIIGRKQAEQFLRKSEEKYRTLIESTLDLIFMVDRKGRFTYVNPMFEKVTGYPATHLIGKPFTYVVAIEHMESMIDRFKKGIKGESISAYETDLMTEKGERIPVEFLVTTLYDEDELPTGRFGIGRDISERKQAEYLYRTLAEQSLAAVFIVQGGKFRYINNSAIAYAGYTAEELIGQYSDTIVHPEDREMVKRKGREMLRGEHSTPYEFRMVTREGKIRWITQIVSSIQYDGNPAILGNAIDITWRKQAEEELKMAYVELKQAQSQLIQAEKAEVIGRLASGVAHEVKNPLAIILQGIDYLSANVPRDNDNFSLTFKYMNDAIKRADNIIKGLMNFARATEMNKAPENLNEIIKGTLQLVSNLLNKSHIEVIRELGEDVLSLSVDKNRIEQVFINLFLNAIDAMPGGGRLKIRTYDEETIEVIEKLGSMAGDIFKQGDSAVVAEIEDTGTGIPTEILEKIFDPFFTTKQDKGGTGLGLSVVRNIMEIHNGLIKIENKKDRSGVRVILVFKQKKTEE